MKKKKIIVILTLVALFLCLLTVTLLGKFAFGWFDEREKDPYVAPELLEGESYYYLGSSQIKNVILMYPQVNRSEVFSVRVHNTAGENYYFLHEQDSTKNYFLLGQSKDGTFNINDADIYYPSIIKEFSSTFDYTSLYDDSSTLPAMLAAVGAVVINERIFPETETGWTEEWLSHYGLSSADDPAFFEVVPYIRDGNGNYVFTDESGSNYVVVNPENGKYHFLNSDGTIGSEFSGTRDDLLIAADTENTMRVFVGRPTVDDKGYYLYLEGRNIVYTTTSTFLNQVVERNIGYYVAPRMVTESESAISFQFSKDFSVWNGKVLEQIGDVLSNQMSVSITSDMVWTVDADSMISVFSNKKYLVDQFFSIADASQNSAFVNAFIGSMVGDKIDVIVPYENLAEINQSITYTILKVEGFFQGKNYLQDSTHLINGTEKIIICYLDGSQDEHGNPRELHGYLDLSDAALPTAFRTALEGKHVQEELVGVQVSYTYDENNSNSYNLEIAVSSIQAIYANTGALKATVGYDNYVTVKYEITQDGQNMGSVSRTFYIPPESDFTSNSAWEQYSYSEYEIYTLRPFFSSLIGKTVGSYFNSSGESLLKTTIVFSREWISDFTLYLGTRINYAVDYKHEIEFGYSNAENPYYGTNSYIISAPEDRVLYGVDEDSAYNILYTFKDLVGTETVALGLNDLNMKKYGLYSNRVYYSMPLDIFGVTNSNGNTYYYSKNSIGFNLYISDKLSNGGRYVGSDMYDIVVFVEDGTIFDFVDWNFETKWVQNSLFMVNYTNLRGLTFDLNFQEEEYNHVYGFDVTIDRAYEYKTQYIQNGKPVENVSIAPKMYVSIVDGGAHQDGATYNTLRGIYEYSSTTNTDNYATLDKELQVKPKPGVHVQTISDTLRYITRLNNGVDLDSVYGYSNVGNHTSYDGVYNLQTLLFVLNASRYWGAALDDMTEAEMIALKNDSSKCVMTLALTLCDENYKNYAYTLRFFTYSSHTLVSITNEETGEESSVFYVQTREVQKLAKIVVGLSKGETIDPDKY